MNNLSIREFVNTNYHHFNAGELSKSAQSLTQFVEDGGRLFITLAGAMSTARLGKTLAPLIRSGVVAGISCTGANLEEDVFLLVAQSKYESIEDWRSLSSKDDTELLDRKPVSYTHLRAHETRHDLVCRLLLEKKK